jgi:NAD/NADP transhydrogenase beta subunit
MENTSCILGDFIGGVTLTGSLIAFGKLNGNLSAMATGMGMGWI